MYPYEIIDEVVPFCPGWHRNAGGKNLLRLISRAVNKLYSEVSWRFKDGSNEGKVPYLLTADNTYEYSIVAANLSCGDLEKTIDGTAYTLIPKKVKKVYMEVTKSISEYQIGLRCFGEQFEENGRWYINVVVDTEIGLDDAPPVVRFLENPGTTTDRFLIDIGVSFPALTAETIPLPVPDDFAEAIVDYCIGTCQKRENGRGSELLINFDQEWIPRFTQYFNSVATSQSRTTKVRIC